MSVKRMLIQVQRHIDKHILRFIKNKKQNYYCCSLQNKNYNVIN